MSKTTKAVEKTYNQKAKDAVMNISRRAVAELYLDSIENQMGGIEEDDVNATTAKDEIAAEFDINLALHVLYKVFGKKTADEIYDGYCHSVMTFEHVQCMVDSLDAGNTIARVIDGDIIG